MKLRGALDEVGKTYHAVSSAILGFKKPAAQQTISADVFLELEGSDLRSLIAAGRGHCHNIDNYYYSGLRDALQAKVNEDKLSSAEMDNIDASFQVLAKGDMELFQPLEQVGVIGVRARRVNARNVQKDRSARLSDNCLEIPFTLANAPEVRFGEVWSLFKVARRVFSANPVSGPRA